MFAAIKLAVPVLAAAVLAFHQLTSALAAPPIGLTNVAGAAGDCTSPSQSAVCATLFPAGASPLYPGGPAEKAQVTITYRASNATSSFGLYLSKFAARAPQSAAVCSAADPASMLDLTVRQGATTIYQGSLSAFAAAHSGPTSMLHLAGGHDGSGAADRWQNGDSSSFSISVALDRAADNAYMGCASTADIDWMAAQ